VARGWALPDALRDAFFIRVHYRAERTYAPEPYPGEILCVYGTGLYDDPLLGWGELATIVPFAVAGEHPNNRATMKEPHAGFIAERLVAALERLESGSTPN
jgi:hypothetical protein